MPAPHFRFLLPPDRPVTRQSRCWREFLPSARRPDALPGGQGIRYGEYFEAAQGFLAADDMAALCRAVAALEGWAPSLRDVAGVDIILEKHGACYHPSRVVARVAGKALSLALNLAVSREGREAMASEYPTLQALAARYPVSLLPRPFARGEAALTGGRTAALFLAEWFDGFHEFHLTGPPADGRTIQVWDALKQNPLLDAGQAVGVYQGAAAILTLYYDLETFRQIFPWHHAAGDFVVGLAGGRPEVRLITARNYRPLFGGGPDAAPEPDPVRMLQGLLLFLVHLSLRMRIDRTDGVGALVWAADLALEGCLAGFWEGLSLKAAFEPDLSPVVPLFRQYLLAAGRDDLADLCRAVARACPPEAPESALMHRHLEAHAKALYRFIREGADRKAS